MKSKKGVLRGPKIQYFHKSYGTVNAKRSKTTTVFLPTLVMLTLMGGGIFGLDFYQSSRVSLRTNEPIKVAAPSPEKETEKQEQTPLRAREDAGLAKLISKKLDTLPKTAKWSIYVRDLKSDRMANINTDQAQEAAGLYKLFLLAPLEKKTNADYWKSNLGNQSIASCAEKLIKSSDDNCANAIGNYVNWKTIDATNESYGFPKTKIKSAKEQQTTAREVGDLVYRLQNGQILSDKARRIVFDGLYAHKHRLGIPIGCGSDCLVGNIAAESNNVKHDAAVVTHGDAKYIVVIMSTGGNWAQIGDIAKTIDSAMNP